jgi:hypothetical protein
MNKQQRNWIIGAVMFGGFLATFFLDLTGLSLHQWLGMGVGALAAYHLLTHWDWVKSVSRRMLGPVFRQAQAYYLVDAGLFGGLALILITGLAMSSWLNLSLPYYDVWRVAHVTVSIATLLAVVAKLAMHWRWILHTARGIFSPAQPAAAPLAARRGVAASGRVAPAASAASPARISRRGFLALSGVLGAAAFIAIRQTLNSAEASTETSAASQQASLSSGSASSGSSGSCSVQCGKHCSYPGGCRRYTDANGDNYSVQCGKHCSYPGGCRRYTDANGDNYCDLGQCV